VFLRHLNAEVIDNVSFGGERSHSHKRRMVTERGGVGGATPPPDLAGVGRFLRLVRCHCRLALAVSSESPACADAKERRRVRSDKSIKFTRFAIAINLCFT